MYGSSYGISKRVTLFTRNYNNTRYPKGSIIHYDLNLLNYPEFVGVNYWQIALAVAIWLLQTDWLRKKSLPPNLLESTVLESDFYIRKDSI